MNDEQVKKIIDSPEEYDGSKEDTILSVIGQLYNRKMRSNFIIHAAYCSIFFALSVFCGVKFFKADQLQFQIMYAALFVCCIQFVAHMKTVYWQTVHRNSVKREIKRLELRIAELNQTIKDK